MKSTIALRARGKKQNLVWSLAAILLLLNSCVKEITLEQQKHSIFPVMNGLFYVGEPSSVFRLSYTSNPFSPSVPYPEGAQVFFYKNGELAGSTQPQAQGYCTIPANFQGTGEVLSVVAVLPEGDTLRANDTIPARSFIVSADFGDAGIMDEYGDIIYKLSVRFKDTPNEKNYYELFVFQWSSLLPSDSSAYSLYNFLYQPNPVLSNEGDQDFEPYTMYFSDDLLEGEGETTFFEQHFISSVNSSRLKPGTPFGVAEPGTYLVFRNISEAHYQFLKSWTRHRYTQKIGQGLANLNDAVLEDYEKVIFAPDPLPMYSNIENGLGVFVGANSQIIKLQ